MNNGVNIKIEGDQNIRLLVKFLKVQYASIHCYSNSIINSNMHVKFNFDFDKIIYVNNPEIIDVDDLVRPMNPT